MRRLQYPDPFRRRTYIHLPTKVCMYEIYDTLC